LDAVGRKRSIEVGHELGISVAHQKLDLGRPLIEHYGQLTGLLGDPFAARVSGHTMKPHQTTMVLSEERDGHPL